MSAPRVRSAWLRLAIALAVIVPVYALHLAAPGLTGTRGTPAGVLLATLIAAVLGVAAYATYVRRIERRPASEVGARGAAGELFAGLAVGAGFFGATIGILALLGVYRVVGQQPLAVAIVPFISAIGTAFIEEILIRGVVFRIAESTLGTWIALVLSSLLFGFLHLMNPAATLQGAVAIVFEAGVLLGAAFVLTRRLWLPIGIHAGWNFTQGGVFGVAVSGHRSQGVLEGTLTGPAWLSGGSFGAEASIVAVVLGIVLGALFVWMAQRRGRFVARSWPRRSASGPGDEGDAGGADPQGPADV